jgi:WD40 repeat protein
MDTTSAPQIIEHHNQSLTFTPYTTSWIPGTAKFVLGGQTPSAKGILKIMQMKKSGLEEIGKIEDGEGIKCTSFGASTSPNQHLAVGDFNGELRIYDIETQ